MEIDSEPGTARNTLSLSIEPMKDRELRVIRRHRAIEAAAPFAERYSDSAEIIATGRDLPPHSHAHPPV
jgi:hypothetical protein